MERFLLLKQISLFFLLLLGGFCFANDLYFLCGPDEDGCFEDDYSACVCIPHDEAAYTPHCLDFERLICVPLLEMPTCRADHIFKNQGDCVATLFHSTPTTPCRVKTYAFCIEHQIHFCEYNTQKHNFIDFM